MTLTEFQTYFDTLSLEAQQLFTAADRMVMQIDDTLSEEFQIATAVRDVFTKRAEAYRESHL